MEKSTIIVMIAISWSLLPTLSIAQEAAKTADPTEPGIRPYIVAVLLFPAVILLLFNLRRYIRNTKRDERMRKLSKQIRHLTRK